MALAAVPSGRILRTKTHPALRPPSPGPHMPHGMQPLPDPVTQKRNMWSSDGREKEREKRGDKERKSRRN